jgi:hypothetical protein
MKKDVLPIDKNGFSNKFFEELEKEHDKVEEFADRQKQLKQKHVQTGLK